jgi:type II secretory pathway component PulK
LRREYSYCKAAGYKKRGSISVFVLWSVTMAALISVGIGYRSYTELRSFRYFQDRFNSRYLVLSGLVKGCDILREDHKNSPQSDNLFQAWADMITISEDGYGSCQIEISDQDRKINLNYFAKDAKDDPRSLNVLVSFLSEELSYGLMDWVDSDGIVSGRLGAETGNYYRFLDYSSRDSELKTLQELRYIKGYSGYMDIAELSKYLTVDTDDIKININTAESEILYRLGLSGRLVARILEHRSEGGSFDTAAVNIADIFPELSGSTVEAEWESVKKYFKVSSRYFKIFIEAETLRGLRRYAQALVKREGSNFRVVYFYDNLDGENI